MYCLPKVAGAGGAWRQAAVLTRPGWPRAQGYFLWAPGLLLPGLEPLSDEEAGMGVLAWVASFLPSPGSTLLVGLGRSWIARGGHLVLVLWSQLAVVIPFVC